MEQESLTRVLAELDEWAPTPEKGLPEEIFLFVSRLVPLVNVDLLIRDEKLGTLLTWRDDEYHGPGWHVPGGIIRYKETADSRIRLTARRELGVEVEYDEEPILVDQAIHPARRERGHYVSLLYRCRLLAAPSEEFRQKQSKPESGEWAWHRDCPADLLPEHEHYRRFL